MLKIQDQPPTIETINAAVNAAKGIADISRLTLEARRIELEAKKYGID